MRAGRGGQEVKSLEVTASLFTPLRFSYSMRAPAGKAAQAARKEPKPRGKSRSKQALLAKATECKKTSELVKAAVEFGADGTTKGRRPLSSQSCSSR